MVNKTIGIIGGGAAGLMAAAAAGHAGCRILLFDSNDRPGRKIYATGNGRCNLTNYRMSDDCYNAPVLGRIKEFDAGALMCYFKDRGIYLHDRDGYVYPRTDQAATIVDALERDLRTMPYCEVHTGSRVTAIRRIYDQYEIKTRQSTFMVDRVILATGGMAGKAFGCAGDGYRFARELGHSCTRLSPALVPVMVDDANIRIMAGVRCYARVTAYMEDRDVYSDVGELQITDTGLSGIPTFQCSRWLSQALETGRPARIQVDLLPELTAHDLEAEITRRQQDETLIYVRDVFAGLVHSKIGSYIARSLGLADEKKLSNLTNRDAVISDLLHSLKNHDYTVTGTAGFDKAQVTAGGIPLDEIGGDFRSRKSDGLYLVGELLDVDGICGGYNLTWAMCSGYIAGCHAALA